MLKNLQDPDNHQKRQREIINEIEEARKELEKKPEKKKFGFFNRKKVAEKKEWETYDESKGDEGGGETPAGFESDRRDINSNNNVLFDVDAIRAELANEHIEIKQLESTLPPMKLDLSASTTTTPEKSSLGPRSDLRQTKSFSAASSSNQEDEKRRSSSVHPESNEGSADRKVDPKPLAGASPLAKTDPPTPAPHRPDLRSSTSMPPVLDLDHNAWLEEEEDFGKEKEVTMSFE